jgi:hypothetical protein
MQDNRGRDVLEFGPSIFVEPALPSPRQRNRNAVVELSGKSNVHAELKGRTE